MLSATTTARPVFPWLKPQEPIPVPGPDPTREPNGGMDKDQLWWFGKVYDQALEKLKLATCAKAVASLAGAINQAGDLTRNPLKTLMGMRMNNRFFYDPKETKIARTYNIG